MVVELSLERNQKVKQARNSYKDIRKNQEVKENEKSTLINYKDLNNILKIKELVKDYPNDMELGGKVRELLWEPKPHYQTKETRDSWDESQS